MQQQCSCYIRRSSSQSQPHLHSKWFRTAQSFDHGGEGGTRTHGPGSLLPIDLYSLLYTSFSSNPGVGTNSLYPGAFEYPVRRTERPYIRSTSRGVPRGDRGAFTVVKPTSKLSRRNSRYLKPIQNRPRARQCLLFPKAMVWTPPPLIGI